MPFSNNIECLIRRRRAVSEHVNDPSNEIVSMFRFMREIDDLDEELKKAQNDEYYVENDIFVKCVLFMSRNTQNTMYNSAKWREYAERLLGVVIHDKEPTEFISRINFPNAVLYCTPPDKYPEAEILANALHDHKGIAAISGSESSEFELYKDWYRIDDPHGESVWINQDAYADGVQHTFLSNSKPIKIHYDNTTVPAIVGRAIP